MSKGRQGSSKQIGGSQDGQHKPEGTSSMELRVMAVLTCYLLGDPVDDPASEEINLREVQVRDKMEESCPGEKLSCGQKERRAESRRRALERGPGKNVVLHDRIWDGLLCNKRIWIAKMVSEAGYMRR